VDDKLSHKHLASRRPLLSMLADCFRKAILLPLR
jgi:hypothetical protein